MEAIRPGDAQVQGTRPRRKVSGRALGEGRGDGGELRRGEVSR